MKTKLLSALALSLLLTVGAYAQDTMATTKKEMRKQEKAERKARMKNDMKDLGQSAGTAASEAGQGMKRKAKVAGAAIDTTAQKVGNAVNKGLDKAENAIVTEGDKLAGIFTERDYARKVALKGKSSKDTVIGDIMTRDLITVTRATTIEDCMQLMTGKYIRHLPVDENGELVGIISIGDVVRTIIEEQKSIIGHMEQYIAGS